MLDNSYGFWRRVRLIPFNRQFKGVEADSKLDEKLKAELPGILAWIVRGCLRWQRVGLKAPKTVLEATEEYRVESDALSEFLAERCELDANAAEAGGRLFEEYRRWATDRKLKEKEVLSQRSFGEVMGERFSKKHHASGARY